MAQRRLYGPAQVATGPATVYTVPSVAGSTQKAVIRHIHLMNPSGSAVTFTASIGADGVTTRIFGALSIPANSSYDWYCVLPMEGAEILTVSAGTNNILVITVAGDLDTI